MKSVLQETVVSAEFNAWAEKQTYKAEAMRVKKMILDEDGWDDIDLTVELFKPIVDLLRLVDTDLPSMGKVSCALSYDTSLSAVLHSTQDDCSHILLSMLPLCRCTTTAH